MPRNLLLTGPPRVGKSTVLDRVAEALHAEDIQVAGIISPEIRTLGHRVGFRIEDARTGEGEILAHVDRKTGPRVGKYRVDVEAVDRVSEAVLGPALDGADVILVDEIAPMETFSDVFNDLVQACLDSDTPVLGTIHRKGTQGVIGEIKQRGDVELVEVSSANRDALPAELTERVLAHR